MAAGKARKYSDRIFQNKKIKLTKCEVIFGANASGKSNLIAAFQFMQQMILTGLPQGFSTKYHRLDPEMKMTPTEFEIEIYCNEKIFSYGFSILLSTGSVLREYLHEKIGGDSYKILFERDTIAETFFVGQYFRKPDSIAKLNSYGEDSVADKEALFLSIINKNKAKMFSYLPELKILRYIFEWFAIKLNISFPDSILTGYPYFTDANLDEIASLLNALGTGISELQVVEVPIEIIKSTLPDELFTKIISDLEKANIRNSSDGNSPKVMVRSYKEFYAFEIDSENKITITTIEFSHERKNIYFGLREESDGIARLLDLIEILFSISNNSIFIIDEIDRCLHPAMTVKIIELFLKMAKKRNTQLIITSHESRLLAADILRNDEICFVIKDSNGSSIINPLEKYQLRADKKVYSALFDGTLDAIPYFNESKLESILSK